MPKDKTNKKESTTVDKAALLVDIKALPVAERKITNGRTTDLVKLSAVVELVEKSL